MKTFKSALVYGVLFVGMAIMSMGITATLPEETSSSEITITKVRAISGDRRPFNWYYPYEYQYYYPRQQYDSCYWIYSDGSYFYRCS